MTASRTDGEPIPSLQYLIFKGKRVVFYVPIVQLPM